MRLAGKPPGAHLASVEQRLGFRRAAAPPGQVPPIEAVTVEVPSEAGPFGAKGVGEPPAAAAAIANAVADATGHRFTELPIRSEAVARTLGLAA